MDTSGADEPAIRADGYGDTNLHNPARDDMFHLSPLPVNIPPLPSAVMGFSALAEDDDGANNGRDKLQFTVYSHSVPRSSTEPIPIPKKSHAPRVSSGLAITVPTTTDFWESGTPCSFPVGRDVPMNSCSVSPVAPSESSRRDRPNPSPAQETKSRQPSPTQQHFYHEERRERDPIEHRRVQLHDLLDSPRSSSLPANSKLQSILSSEPRPSTSRSHSLQSVSQASLPPHPIPTPSPGAGSKPPSPSPSNLSQSYGSRYGNSSRPTLISHASSAAIQLERERQRAEKERESTRERDRRQAGSSSSLRDSTNAHHRMGNVGHGNGKAKVAVYA